MAVVTTSSNGAGADPLPDHGLGVYEQLMAMVPGMQEELLRLGDQREELISAHRDQLAELDQKRRRILGLLKHLGHDLAQPRGRRSAPAKRDVSRRILLKLVETIEKHGDERFTALQIHEEAGATWATPRTYSGIQILRELEFVSPAGTEGDKPHGRGMFMILDREAGERLKAEGETETRQPRRTNGHGISFERIEVVANAFRVQLGEDNSSVTVKHVAQALGWDTHKLRGAVGVLVDAGYLIEDGQRRVGGARTPSTFYKLGDLQALETLRGADA